MITITQAKECAKGFQVVPIYTEILADVRTPIEVLQALKKVSRHCYLLESVENQEIWGRYTYLGYDPKMEITCKDGMIHIRNEQKEKMEKGDPGECIKRILSQYTSPRIEELPTFTGGLVGYFAYDYAKYKEPKLKMTANDEEQFCDVDLMLFDKVIAFDNVKQKIYVIANANVANLEEDYTRCEKELNEMVNLIKTGDKLMEAPGRKTSEFVPLFSKDAYCEMVEKAKRYIYEGDIFQVVLSNRLEANYEGSLLNAYRYLRTTNPSPYMFYFSSDDMEVAGASPETLVKLEQGTLHTFPLAGTRPRGKSLKEDAMLEKELLADEKERAEHNMLVDLGRNDLGKISKFGSVQVEKYMEIQRFSHVMHIGSTVASTIQEPFSNIDAIDAVLPAGTLSGAPKIRAMEIINELEDNKRGIYGGAIGYLDFTGNMDTCIAIRIAYKKNGKVFIRSGAGIVADSVPEKEFMECMNKARAVINAIEEGQKKI
ncbi:anthranilate synthase component I [Anaerosporobacter faecicola]|uniref:anthranilate synthase component I n=1 Tax=Anaerosporobacter faecicola TaxID=2718714 RepID=UPI0014397E17|nr:anthranilate synthase component I [Anaerosporobacter faecicola]